MKPSLDKSKQSASFSTVPDYSTYEYHWDGPKRFHVPVWQPRQTTLLVVFDGESRHLFSTARILVYYNNGSLKDARSSNVWVRLALAHSHLPNYFLKRCTGHSTTGTSDPFVQKPSSQCISQRVYPSEAHGRVRSRSWSNSYNQVFLWYPCPSVPSKYPGASPQLHSCSARTRTLVDFRHLVSRSVLHSFNHALHPHHLGRPRPTFRANSPRLSD